MAKCPRKNPDTPSVCHAWNQAAVHWQQSQHCKLTMLQHSKGTMLDRRKEKQSSLFPPASLTWSGVPSLDPEWAWVPQLDWDGVKTVWHGALHWTFLRSTVCYVLACIRVPTGINVLRNLGAIITKPPNLLVLGIPAQDSFFQCKLSRVLRTQEELV